jgi:hypothetical protein
LSVSAKAKSKASTVIRALDALERASRWRPLAVFFDEFQEIVENLEERDSRHLLGAHNADIASSTKCRICRRQYHNSDLRVGVHACAHCNQFIDCAVTSETIPRLRLIHRRGHNRTFLGIQ